MANDLQFRIGADIAEVKAALFDLGKEFKKLGQAQAAQPQALKGIDTIAGQANAAARAVKALVAGFAAFQAVRVLQQAATAGVQFNAQLETAQLGIASIIASQAKLVDGQGQAVKGAEALAAAYGLAEEQVFKLRVAGLETAATSQQLAEAFQAAVGAGIGAGLNLDQIRGLTIQIVQAAGALGVPMNQIAQEVRSILDGTIDINSRVAVTLGITNEQVRNWKTQGTLVEELNKRMGAFTQAGKEAGNTFAVITSNAAEAVQSLAGDVFKGFFEELKGGIKDATSGLFDTQNLTINGDLSDAVGLARELATAVGSGLADALRGIVALAREFSTFIKENRTDIDILLGTVGALLSVFGRLVSEVASLVTGITGAGLKMGILQAAVTAVALLVAGVQDGFRAIAGLIVGAGAVLVTVLVLPLERFIRQLAAGVSLVNEKAAGSMRGIADGLAEIRDGGFGAAGDLFKPLLDGKGAVASLAAELLLLQQRMAALAGSNREEDALELKRIKARADAIKAAQRGAVAGRANPVKAPGADQNQVLQAQLQQQQKELDQNYEDGLKSLSDYFLQRGQLQAKAIDAELAAERVKQGRLAEADESGRREAATKIALLEEKKAAADRDNSRARFVAEREFRSQLVDLQAQAFEDEGRFGDAAALRTQERFRALLTKLAAEGDSKSIDLVNRLIDIDVARARLKEVQRAFDLVADGLAARQAEIQRQVREGTITPGQGNEADRGAVEQAAQSLQGVNAQLQALKASTTDPELLAAIDQIGEKIKRVGDAAQPTIATIRGDLAAALADMDKNLAKSAVGAGVDALTNFFTSLGDSSKSAGEKIKDFVRGFAASMAQIAARALATFLVLQLLDAVFPGAGKAAAASMSVGANVKHSGGKAGHGPRRQVSPWVFAGAPRLHDGSGVLGLKPDEIPTILQTGESVNSRADNARAAAGGGGGGTRIINVIDPNLVGDYLNSAAGERTVLNVLERNAGSVRQKLA